ncbi:zinc finger protein 239-like [Pollicipes pollicipes]|uniref:zinc finger protein 239-like n=1 Tax=Pollicipes pollicipes TaxID=41117 RepID=UPI001884FB97|nr:zinc finger protein 239-like [Pollicipes pollicipes]
MALHSSPRPYKCGVCAREFRTSALHRQHILQHIPARIRDQVGSELAPPAVAATAVAAELAPPPPPPLPLPPAALAPNVEQRKPVSCATCGATFAQPLSLQRHTLQQHRQPRRPVRRICSCDHCGRIFYSYKQLKWHAEIHGKRPHTCSTCGLRFLHQSWLTRHIRSQHNPRFVGRNSGESRPCPVCNKVYMRTSLRAHVRMMHQDAKPYQCARCGRRFSAKCNLQSHVLSHLSYRDRPFKCDQCRKAYTTDRDLRVHKATHEGKRYPCKVCGREFSRVSSMNVHLREHDGEKKHMCGVCGKRFARKAYLMAHVRIHTGERPHVCTVCDRSFASRSNYNAHVKNHGRREPVNAEL